MFVGGRSARCQAPRGMHGRHRRKRANVSIITFILEETIFTNPNIRKTVPSSNKKFIYASEVIKNESFRTGTIDWSRSCFTRASGAWLDPLDVIWCQTIARLWAGPRGGGAMALATLDKPR